RSSATARRCSIPRRCLPMRHASSSSFRGASAMLIDATRKWNYPPISLPKEEFTQRARRIWEDERLPALSPKTPWFGYPLGPWPAEWEEEADVAVKSRYYETGEKAPRRVLLTEARQASQPVARSSGSPAGGWTSPYCPGPHAKTNLLMLLVAVVTVGLDCWTASVFEVKVEPPLH